MEKAIFETLSNKGVIIIAPQTVFISDDVSPDNIEEGVTIYPGCRISGKKTFIGKGTKLGQEAPVTVENCAIGHDVELKGGYFKKAVFLDKSSMGSGAHVREGSIIEEEANAAHTVGLKQTILFPFVTLGSLINFCDCMMAGGTSRKDHSEVGSSYIHFNFTPNMDKATPSIMGDVPRGVRSPHVVRAGRQGLHHVHAGRVGGATHRARTVVVDLNAHARERRAGPGVAHRARDPAAEIQPEVDVAGRLAGGYWNPRPRRHGAGGERAWQVVVQLIEVGASVGRPHVVRPGRQAGDRVDTGQRIRPRA